MKSLDICKLFKYSLEINYITNPKHFASHLKTQLGQSLLIETVPMYTNILAYII